MDTVGKQMKYTVSERFADTFIQNLFSLCSHNAGGNVSFQSYAISNYINIHFICFAFIFYASHRQIKQHTLQVRLHFDWITTQ